jgi:Flp pilus assembly protein CpaB
MKKVYLIAVIFALLAGFATYMFATQIDAKTTIKDADTVSVYVATKDIPENTEITEEMFSNDDEDDGGYFTKKSIVTDYAVPNYVSKKDDLVGFITVDPIYSGEQISSSRLISVEDDQVSLSFKLDDGKVAYSFSSGTVSGVDGFITKGDTVDVIVYTTDDNGNSKAEVAYEDLKILRVSNAGDNETANSSGSSITTYNSLTVEVTEKQALQLYEIENENEFKLVLNPRG